MTKKPKIASQQAHANFKRVTHNVSWLVGEQILRMGTGFFVGTWVARYLGVQQYGILNYAIAFTSIFNPFVSLGLDSIVIKRLSQSPLEKGKILGTAFLLKVLSSIMVIGLICVSSLIINQKETRVIHLTVILSICGLFQSLDVITLWFQSQIQSKYIVASKNIAYLFSTLLKVALIWFNAPLIGFAYAALLEIVLLAINLLIAYQGTRNSTLLWCWSLSTAKSLLREGYPLLLSGFAVIIYLRIDQVMLNAMVDERAVGLYSAATRISEIFYFIPTVVISSISPIIYAARQVSLEYYYQQIQRLLQFMAVFAFLVIGAMSLLCDRLILTLFGSDYAAAGQILAIHIWASAFVFVGSATSPWFISEKLTHLYLRRTSIGAVTNILLNLYLIPQYAGVGAAIATVISYSFSDLFSNATHPKTRKIFVMQIQSLFLLKSPLLVKLQSR